MLLIGNASKPFTPEEVAAVKDYVANGGGLLLAGLGWSWKSSGGKSGEPYPMDQMGEPFGVKWLTTTVDDSEPKHKFKFQRPGQPEEEATSFHTFYPKAQQ